MDMDQAAVFLAGTILTALGFIVILGTIVLANNIIHRWWKPLGWNFGMLGGPPARFATPEELEHSPKIEPRIEKSESKATTG